MGDRDLSRDRRYQSEAEETGQMVDQSDGCDGTGSEDGQAQVDLEGARGLCHGAGARGATSGKGHIQRQRRDTLHPGTHGHAPVDGGDDGAHEGGDPGPQESAPRGRGETPQEGEVDYEVPSEGRLGVSRDYSTPCEPSEGTSRNLSQTEARILEERGFSVVPGLMQQLVASDGEGGMRPILMEVACEPNSQLTSAVQQRTGDAQSATRCSLWNSGDLSSKEGLQFVLQRLRLERPQHVWIAPPGGPFSPWQSLNQRTEAQKQELKEKRREIMRIYVGVCCVFHACIQQGTHCTVELPDRCDAWRPYFRNFRGGTDWGPLSSRDAGFN